MNTNNGLERKNRDFKDGFLKQLKAKSFSGMLTALIDQFLSEKHDRYNPKPFFFYTLNPMKTYLGHLPRFSFSGSNVIFLKKALSAQCLGTGKSVC